MSRAPDIRPPSVMETPATSTTRVLSSVSTSGNGMPLQRFATAKVPIRR